MPVDAFFHSGEGKNCLVVPPVGVITRVLSYISLRNVAVTLVVPPWPSATLWALLWQRCATMVEAFRYFKGNCPCCYGGAERCACINNRQVLVQSSVWASVPAATLKPIIMHCLCYG